MSTTTAGYITVSSVTMVTSLAGGILSFKGARTHGDPVRNGFKWVAVALTAQFLGSIIKLAAYARTMVKTKGYRPHSHCDIDFTSGAPLDERSYWALHVSDFFNAISLIALFVALIDVGIGFRVMLGSRPKRANCQQWTAKVMGIIMILLALVSMVGGCLSLDWYSGDYTGMEIYFMMLPYTTMGIIWQILLFIGLIWVLISAIKVSRRVKVVCYDSIPIGRSKVASLYYAAAGVVWLSSLFWVVKFIISYTPPFTADSYNAFVASEIMYFTSSLLSSFCPTVSLILLVVLASRKADGLWSTSSSSSTTNKMAGTHGHVHQAHSHIV